MILSRKVTKEIFEKRLYDKFGDDVKLVGEFNGLKGKTTFKSDVCNHEWEQVARNIFKNKFNGCLKCNIKENAQSYVEGSRNKKITPEIFKDKVYEAVGGEYTVLEDYKQNKIPVLIRHNSAECNYYTWKVYSNNFLAKGSRCPICSVKKKGLKTRKTNEEFIEELKEKFNNEYTPLEEYEISSKHILVRHNEKYCNNHEWRITPVNLLRGFGCPVCGIKKAGDFHKKSEKDFLDKVREVHGDNYKVLSSYKGDREYVEVLHVECGKTWNIIPNALQKGVGCTYCKGKHRKTTEQYKKEIKEKTNGAYEVIGEYINAHTPIKIRHIENNCNHEFTGTPNSLMYAMTCGACYGSGGEKIIAAYLKKNNLNFSTQYTFDDCRNVYPLKFDFAILNSTNKVVKLIEFDGRQHFEPVDWWGGEEEFKNNKIRDSIKDNYCEKNNIPLIRIPYWEFKNINSILDEEL